MIFVVQVLKAMGYGIVLGGTVGGLIGVLVGVLS